MNWIIFFLSIYHVNQESVYWTANSPLVKVVEPKQKFKEFTKNTLRSGDIIHRDDDVYFGFFHFNRYIRNITNSKYSHTGIIDRSNPGNAYVYDITPVGVRHIPFCEWIKESNSGHFLVQRVISPCKISSVLDWCNDQYLRGVDFDYNLSLINKKFYCVEFTVKAFMSQRLLLMEPIKAGNLEKVDKYIWQSLLVLQFTGLTPEDPVFVCGNASSGLISSKHLTKVFEGYLRNENFK